MRIKQTRELAALNAAASTQIVSTFSGPVEILSVKLVSTIVGTVNTACNVRVNKRTIAGNTSSGVTNAYAGTFTIATNVAQGAVICDSTPLYNITCAAGDQLAFEAVNVSIDAYPVIPFIEFVQLDEEDANLSGYVAS